MLTIIIALILLCLALYAINRYMPGDPALKNIICLVIVLAVIAWIARTAGLF
jgi:hypothetical protein